MTRKIKFRAWDKKSKEIYDFSEIGHWDLNSAFGFKNHEHPDWIFMQFTGLKDKKGKDIYEGDVVDISGQKGPKKNQFIWALGWDNEDLCWSFVYETGEPARSINRKDKECMEIIGNIYEHPELLSSK